MEQDLYAFWKYDLFPYCLSGTIVSMRETGVVETKEYGKGQGFKPFLILPKKAGIKLKVDIDNLKFAYEEEQKALKYKYKRALQDIIEIPKWGQNENY